MLNLELTQLLDSGSFDSGGWCWRWLVSADATGFRSGYLAVPPGHPWHSVTWYEDVDVHNGLNYAALGTEGEWWIGFSASGRNDSPDQTLCLFDATVSKPGVVRSTAFIINELQGLVTQALTPVQDEALVHQDAPVQPPAAAAALEWCHSLDTWVVT